MKEKKKFVWEVKRGMRHGEPVILQGEGDKAVRAWPLLMFVCDATLTLPACRPRSLERPLVTSSSPCNSSRIRLSARVQRAITTS